MSGEGDPGVPGPHHFSQADYDDLPRQADPPRGWVRPFVPGTLRQLALLASVAETWSEKERRFLLHVLDSGRKTGWAPVSAKLIERHFRGVRWQELVVAGLLEVRPYDRRRGLSRAFRAASALRRQFAEAGPTAEEVVQSGLVDLVSERPTRRRVKSIRNTATGKPLPPLVRAAIDAVSYGRFSAGDVEDHLESLRTSATVLPPVNRAAAEARYHSDASCYAALWSQGAEPVDPTAPRGECVYRPAWQPQISGRIGQVGGGLQSASKAMKHAAYRSDPAVRNLDLVSSQPRALSVLLHDGGYGSPWLERYVADPSAKRAMAAEVGVDVGSWKEALYALVMGARVPPPRLASRSRGAVATALRRGSPPGEFQDVYGRFLDETEELRDRVGEWHRWLTGVYVPSDGRRYNRDGKTYLTNRVGARVAVEDLGAAGPPWRLRARLAAFLLQGVEAALVHTVAVEAVAVGVQVLSHEHDGLVVRGIVPPEAVRRGADAAGLPLRLVDLVEKPFVTGP